MTYQQPLPCNIAVSDRYPPIPTVQLLYPPLPTPPPRRYRLILHHSAPPKSNLLPPLTRAGRNTSIHLYTLLVYSLHRCTTYSFTNVALICAVSYDLHIYLHQSTWSSSRPQPYLPPSAAFYRSGDVQASIEPSGLWPRPFPSPGKPIRLQSP
ncbi:hypothetical protein COCCADRAFT_34447 [Bipolaris zeicola 26-R-13]|uniref:Uncharacterized protein n=1 Tax=Cochliobolus carbonum (strain 26-R-13) TaxID=930089 RepID=W6YXK1_COCC2|nr:uncharacterized protein COCCADRAFT_34447 [Bipolaris zeicola 26-R-13]EUC36166.1 hypothetical protein COCCADRAFT_34447 [Bipolaris zeicola 26-R-13]